MDKKTTLAIAIIVVILLLIIGLYASGKLTKTEQPEAKIRQTLTGMELDYSNIAGEKMTFTITADDIKSIEKTTLDNQTVWKAHIGEVMAWDIYFDETGNTIVKEEPLFRS